MHTYLYPWAHLLATVVLSFVSVLLSFQHQYTKKDIKGCFSGPYNLRCWCHFILFWLNNLFWYVYGTLSRIDECIISEVCDKFQSKLFQIQKEPWEETQLVDDSSYLRWRCTGKWPFDRAWRSSSHVCCIRRTIWIFRLIVIRWPYYWWQIRIRLSKW